MWCALPCRKRDLNSHDIAIIRTWTVRVCQFRHSCIYWLWLLKTMRCQQKIYYHRKTKSASFFWEKWGIFWYSYLLEQKSTPQCDVLYRAGKETWTLMILLSYGPEPYASANSAIPAFIDCSFWKPCAVNKKYVITENRRVQAFFEKNDKFFDIPIYCKKECALAHSRAEARLL